MSKLKYLWRILVDGWHAESQVHYPTTSPQELAQRFNKTDSQTEGSQNATKDSHRGGRDD